MKPRSNVLLSVCLGGVLLTGVTGYAAPVTTTPFVAYRPTENFTLPEIVLQYDAATKTGWNWDEIKNPQWYQQDEPSFNGRAVIYLREGLKRMTGKDFPVVSKNDLSRGIVLTLLKNAPEELRRDSEIQKALAPGANAPYSAKEAFYLRSEKDRLLVIANTTDGLRDAVAGLLETVDYEVLGAGVDWISVPDHRFTPLSFSVNRADRPSFYIRNLWAHSAQSLGYGTILSGLTDPNDEIVTDSYYRWVIGARFFGKSMPEFPGHTLQGFNQAIMDRMRERNDVHGFLASNKLGLAANRPAAADGLKGTFWINTDTKGTPDYGKIYWCDGKTWIEGASALIDVSVQFVRDMLFEDMKKKTEAAFTVEPDDPYSYSIEPDDGGTTDADRERFTADKNWFPDYLKKEKLPFGRPYLLHEFHGLDQPTELWDGASESDNQFALAAYLLHEYDKWIDSLPPEQRVTSTGKSKKALIRCSMQSYNYHDVPPNFNPDPRTRVGIAPFPKHRGIGKWEKISTSEDIAKALHIMMPSEPASDYFFYSNSKAHDGGSGGIPPMWDTSTEAIAKRFRDYYANGFRAITVEMDLNFGKYGLGYYLTSKMLWNAKLTPKDLDAIRDRWMQRSFGSAWKEMKAYYDFLVPANYGANSPNAWAKATHLLDAADKKIDGAKEPAQQRRIDDVKQYWYVHYLFDSGKYTKDSPEVREFLWKGQMAYIVGLMGLVAREYNTYQLLPLIDPKIAAGPAHYTHEETQAWWPKVLDFWQVKPVTLFADATLANGQAASKVDLNDLVIVKEFAMTPNDGTFFYNSGYMAQRNVLTYATKKNDVLGFKLLWPFLPDDSWYRSRKVYYGADIWNPAKKTWDPWLDHTMVFQQSEEIALGQQKFQIADVKIKAPKPGLYRITVGYGGLLATLAGPTYIPASGQFEGRVPFTYFGNTEGLTQSKTYIYIPKGTKTFDLEVWDESDPKTLTLYKGLPETGMTISRKVDVHGLGVHNVPLQPDEDGSFATIEGNNFFFPYLYSVPSLWAKSPPALLVPRAIAQADGLTILSDSKVIQAQ